MCIFPPATMRGTEGYGQEGMRDAHRMRSKVTAKHSVALIFMRLLAHPLMQLQTCMHAQEGNFNKLVGYAA